MTDCVFCKILKGEIPSFKIYEDGHAIAFLDIAPFEKGHTLVVPKCHVPHLTDLPAGELSELMKSVQNVAKLLYAKLGCDGLNMLQNNGECAMQTVPHFHIHLIPRWKGKKLNWIPGKYDSPDEMKALFEKLTR